MHRRRFLQGLLGVSATTVGIGQSAARVSSQSSMRPSAFSNPRRRVLIQQSAVAGFQFHEGEFVFARMKLGDRLNFRRDPNNRFDQRAVQVYWQDTQLGFVPRRDNVAISQMLERGEPLTASITALRESENPWDRVRFDVTWQDTIAALGESQLQAQRVI